MDGLRQLSSPMPHGRCQLRRLANLSHIIHFRYTVTHNTTYLLLIKSAAWFQTIRWMIQATSTSALGFNIEALPEGRTQYQILSHCVPSVADGYLDLCFNHRTYAVSHNFSHALLLWQSLSALSASNAWFIFEERGDITIESYYSL